MKSHYANSVKDIMSLMQSGFASAKERLGMQTQLMKEHVDMQTQHMKEHVDMQTQHMKVMLEANKQLATTQFEELRADQLRCDLFSEARSPHDLDPDA